MSVHLDGEVDEDWAHMAQARDSGVESFGLVFRVWGLGISSGIWGFIVLDELWQFLCLHDQAHGRHYWFAPVAV